MGHNQKPHQAEIQEFRATAYVKDLAAGKLDARATKGQFVSYDSESKGYQIYWPGKHSITVDQNVIFNQEDTNTHNNTAIIHVLCEGENKKVIQNLQNNVKDVKNPENKKPEAHQSPQVHQHCYFSNIQRVTEQPRSRAA